MSVQYYPTVLVSVSFKSVETVESICDRFENLEAVETRNRESKVTRKTINGSSSVEGYIKFSFTLQSSVDVFLSYNADEGELTIQYQSDRFEVPKEFSDVIDAFAEVIVPVVEDEYGEDRVSFDVTTRRV
jgi:hypothetical protein